MIAYKIAAHAADVARDGPAPATATMPSAGALHLRLGEAVRAFARPRNGSRHARRDTAGRVLQGSRLLLHVRPEILLHELFVSKVDEYNKQVHGIEKKDYSELVDRLVTLK